MIDMFGQENQYGMGMRQQRNITRPGLTISGVVVLMCCLLVAFGSLRNIVSPMGYWSIWAGVLLFGWFGAGCRFLCLVSSKEVRVITVGYVLLCLGLLFSGLVNEDRYTLFQLVKYFCIYIAFLVVCASSKSITGWGFLMISRLTIGLAFLLFLVCKFVFVDFFVLLGDGREGSEFAYPGVMWKTSVFFSGFILASVLVFGASKKIDMIVVVLSVSLLLFDSSRTGLLWFAVTCLAVFLKVGLYRMYKMSPVYLSAGALVVLLLAVFFGSLDFAIFERLFQMDNVRGQMLKDGVFNVVECIPWGCGFGSSHSMVSGEAMVVHNAYLGALADIGVIGFVGLLMLTLAPVYIYFSNESLISSCGEGELLAFVAMLGAVGYGFLMLLHPLSSELSEWGVWILMVSWQFSLSRENSLAPKKA